MAIGGVGVVPEDPPFAIVAGFPEKNLVTMATRSGLPGRRRQPGAIGTGFSPENLPVFAMGTRSSGVDPDIGLERRASRSGKSVAMEPCGS